MVADRPRTNKMTNEAPERSVVPTPSWQADVQAAVNETDSRELLARVHAAETAIFNRLQSLAAQAPSEGAHSAERAALAEAVETLRSLKRDRLGFPDWIQK